MKMQSEYSIVSIGTERNGSDGYMCISEVIHQRRYIVPLSHQTQEIHDLKYALEISKEVPIEIVAVSRFQLITALAQNGQWRSIKNALVIGSGALGFATYLELKRNQVKNVEMISRRKESQSKYKNSFAIFDYKDANWKQYDTFFECTGDHTVIEHIIEVAPLGSYIYLIGTPREGPCVNMLTVHRRNLKFMGVHEINGMVQEKRQEVFNKIINDYAGSEPYYLNEIVKIHSYSQEALREILEHNFVEPMHVLKHIWN